MKKLAGIYDPYLDTLGGGERYCLTVAEILCKNGYDVDIFWSGEKDIIQKAQSRFDLELSSVNIVEDIFTPCPKKIELISDPISIKQTLLHKQIRQNLFDKIKTLINKYKVTQKYDLFFYISDWSVPFLFSKNNLLHVQVPFVFNPSLKEKFLTSLKTVFFKKIICNSRFTSAFAITYFGDKCFTLYPPVDIDKFESSFDKKNIILSVGRFDNILNSKKQDILIEAFKKLHQQNPNSTWKLVLAGGSLENPQKNSYLKHLKLMSGDLPVEFMINPSFQEIKNIYAESKIYWHAAGYDVDQKLHPENTEHFGIAPVEAMAAGSVPIVVSKGGLPEIVDPNINGYLWDTIDDLVSKTQSLISSPEKLSIMSLAAQKKCQKFSKDNFSKDLMNIIN